MSVSRVRAVRRYKRKQWSKLLNGLILPPVVLGVSLFGVGRKKRRRR